MFFYLFIIFLVFFNLQVCTFRYIYIKRFVVNECAAAMKFGVDSFCFFLFLCDIYLSVSVLCISFDWC